MGHAGTLDPMATGLLVVLVGRATKQQERFMGLEKTYEAEVTLGATSTTDDGEGTITDWSTEHEERNMKPDENEVEQILNQFTGEIEQVPPRHSAVKVQGQRAYKLARNGEEVELEPRPVTVHDVSDINYDYPVLELTLRVSSGTYIRSLARDMGEALDTGGYLSSLRRTRIGEHSVDDAVSPESNTEQIRSNLTPIDF